MHIMFKKHGQGSTAKAIAYVLGQYDAKGRERDAVKVLRGNPDITARLADSLTAKRKYTSAVIAWSPDDQPTADQIDDVLNDFERAAFSGLDPERYCWTAVRHDDGDATHVHIIIARTDLQSGLTYNPAPPGWRSRFEPLRDYYNAKYGWASPNDPSRRRPSVAPDHENKQFADARRDGRQILTHRKGIEDWITHLVDRGMIHDRAGVKATLKQLGTITREGNEYISVRPSDRKQAIRLKGLCHLLIVI